VTRTALATPEEPEDPFDRLEAELADVDAAFGTLPEPSCDAVESALWTFSSRSSGPLELKVQRHIGSKSNHVLIFHTKAATNSVWMHITDHDRLAPDRRVVVATDPAKALRSRLSFRKQYTRVSPQKLTSLAVFIAGRDRSAVGCEWRSHLGGETGAGLSADRQVREAAGFVLAAVHYRFQDATELAWRPVDAVLGSRAMSNCFVLLATLGFSLWFTRKVGVYGLAASLESVAVVFFASLGVIHVGRRWRDVKPPEHKPRRAKELGRLTLTSARVATL